MTHEYWSMHNDVVQGRKQLVRSTDEPRLSIQGFQNSRSVPVTVEDEKPVLSLSSCFGGVDDILEAELLQNRRSTQSKGFDDEFTILYAPIGDDYAHPASPKIESLDIAQYRVDEAEPSKDDDDLEMETALELVKKALSLVPGHATLPTNEYEVVIAVAHAINAQTALYHKQAIEIQRLRDMLGSPSED